MNNTIDVDSQTKTRGSRGSSDTSTTSPVETPVISLITQLSEMRVHGIRVEIENAVVILPYA